MIRMSKKHTGKLLLNRETFKSLSPADLAQAGGGIEIASAVANSTRDTYMDSWSACMATVWSIPNTFDKPKEPAGGR